MFTSNFASCFHFCSAQTFIATTNIVLFSTKLLSTNDFLKQWYLKLSPAAWGSECPALTWMGKTAASRTRNGLTLKALLRAAAWYTAPMAAASSALMFFPSSSLHGKIHNYNCRYSQANHTCFISVFSEHVSVDTMWKLWRNAVICAHFWKWKLFRWVWHLSGWHLLAHSFKQHFLNLGDTRGATY